MAGAGRHRRGDRAAAERGAHDRQPRAGTARAVRRVRRRPGWAPAEPLFTGPEAGRRLRRWLPRSLRLVPGCRRAGRRRVRRGTAAWSRPGTRGRCCCTRSSPGRPPDGARRAGQGPGDVQLLTGVSMCFALGAATAEQFKHLAAAEAGPLPGWRRCPGCGRCARNWPGSPTRATRCGCDAVRRGDARRRPVTSGVYYVDDHFVPYTGAKPVAKAGTTSGAGRAGPRRHPRHRTRRRAVCFVSGEPSG